MKDILSEIIDLKHVEVGRQKEALPLQTLLGGHAQRMERTALSMRKALETSASGIIAEFKRRSPSKRYLRMEASVEDIIPAYERAGAAACSILTDGHFFGGSFFDFRQARSLVPGLPLLRKDFIIDEYQVYQSKMMGADCILLIAACLTEEECSRFASLAYSLGMEVLLEVHAERELAYWNEHIDMLGVNNRNLGTFHTDVGNSFRIAEAMESLGDAALPVLVSESGLSDPETVRVLRSKGFQGFLIGETFMIHDSPGEGLASFIRSLS